MSRECAHTMWVRADASCIYAHVCTVRVAWSLSRLQAYIHTLMRTHTHIHTYMCIHVYRGARVHKHCNVHTDADTETSTYMYGHAPSAS